MSRDARGKLRSPTPLDGPGLRSLLGLLGLLGVLGVGSLRRALTLGRVLAGLGSPPPHGSPAPCDAPSWRAAAVLSALAGGALLGGRYGSPPVRVVALHGWGRAHDDFDTVLEGLDAVAPDLPGFGATAAPPRAWGASDYAEAVLPLCGDGPPVVLVGHSFGARAAVVLAAAHPDRVAALVLTGAPLLRASDRPPPGPRLAHRMARRLNRIGLVSDRALEARRRRSGSEDYRRATGVMRDVLVRAIAETDDGTYTRALAALTCPVELVWGEHDTAAPPGVARRAAALTADARVTVVEGAGHLTPSEAPQALRAAIERHL